MVGVQIVGVFTKGREEAASLVRGLIKIVSQRRRVLPMVTPLQRFGAKILAEKSSLLGRSTGACKQFVHHHGWIGVGLW